MSIKQNNSEIMTNGANNTEESVQYIINIVYFLYFYRFSLINDNNVNILTLTQSLHNISFEYILTHKSDIV